MQKILLTITFCLLLIVSASMFGGLAYGKINVDNNGKHNGNNQGGGGTPEPASIILIIGGAAALGIKGLLNKKK